MPTLDILFFYLVEEQKTDEETQSPLGYIHIADLANKKSIEKIEVSYLVETFFSFQRYLTSIMPEIQHPHQPQSAQCFAVAWDTKVAERFADHSEDCLICREIAETINSYCQFLRESGRLSAVA